MKFAAFFAISALSLLELAAGQTIPACIVNCSTQAAAASGCASLSDVSCWCTNDNFMNALGACLVANCTNDEQQAATTLNQSVLCGSVPTSGGGGGSGRPVGAIVGGTVGGVAFLVLLAVLLFFCLKRRARERRDSKDQNKTSEKRKTGVMDFLAGRGSRSERGLSDENQVSAGLEGDEYQPSPFSYLDSTQAEGLTGAAAVAAAATGAGVGNRDSLPASEKTESPSAAVFVASTDTRPSFEWNTTSSNTHPATRRHRVQKNSSIAKHGQQGGVPVGETPAAAGHPLPGTPTRRFVQHEDSGEVVDLPPRYDQMRTGNSDSSP